MESGTSWKDLFALPTVPLVPLGIQLPIHAKVVQEVVLPVSDQHNLNAIHASNTSPVNIISSMEPLYAT